VVIAGPPVTLSSSLCSFVLYDDEFGEHFSKVDLQTFVSESVCASCDDRDCGQLCVKVG
jgi:hypothetical protein